MPHKQRFWVGLVFLGFLLAGCAAFGQLVAVPLWRQSQVRSWQATPCRIVTSELDSKGKFQFAFQYTVGGKTHESGRYGFVPIGTAEVKQFRELTERYPVGSKATCFVNPVDPDDVVLDRDLPGRIWSNAPILIFVVIGAAGLVWVSGLFGRPPITDARLAAICGDRSLESLDLACSSVTDAGLIHLRGLSALNDLDLSQTEITDEGLRELKSLEHLKTLTLNDTGVTDDGVEHLAELDQLNSLALARTKLTDRTVAILASMSKLEDLNLTGTAVTPEGVERLRAALPSCEITV